jgi:hypothetical protein
MSWNRLKSVVRSVQAAIATESTLAPLRPLAQDALELLSRPPTEEAKEELDYLLTKIQEFVIPWRPSPDPDPEYFYLQPNWAKSTDNQAAEALDILRSLPSTVTSAATTTVSDFTNPTMKVFLSHSSADQSAAEAFVELVRTALNLPAREIRCTSVDGYKLSAGADANEQLRAEVFGCETFIALLSPASMSSIYVMFELGARWGTKRHLAPIMIGGTKPSDLKSPLSGIHSISGTSESDLYQLIEDLGTRVGQSIESPAVYAKALRDFVKKASAVTT